MESRNPQILQALQARLGPFPFEMIPHERFKELTHQAAAVIRSGECTPYANIILVSGVVF
jgi:D-ribose pyranase